MINAGVEPQNEEEVHVDTCIPGTLTAKLGQIQTYAISAECEEKTVKCQDKMIVL